MASEKRLIYAEDLFEPVDVTVLRIGGRSGGKTMALYEQLFRKRVEMAPTIDAVEVVRCKDCAHAQKDAQHGDYWCHGTTRTFGDFFCAAGERRDNEDS